MYVLFWQSAILSWIILATIVVSRVGTCLHMVSPLLFWESPSEHLCTDRHQYRLFTWRLCITVSTFLAYTCYTTPAYQKLIKMVQLVAPPLANHVGITYMKLI